MNKNRSIVSCGLWILMLVLIGILRPARAQDLPAVPPGARRLTLSEAVALALKNSRDIQLAQTDVTVAVAGQKEAASPFRPEIYLGSGLAATKGFPLSIEGSAPSIFTVSGQQAIFNPYLKNIEKQAGQMQAAAQKSLEQKRDDIVAQTVLTYLDLDRGRRSLQYLKGYTENLLEAEQIISERVQAGLEPPVEETRAKLNTARSRSDAVGLANQIAMLEFTLHDMTGIPQSEPLALEEAKVPAVPVATPEELISQALEKNQGIQALEDQIHAKELQVRSEQAARWPRINLVGQYGLFSDINNFSSYFRKFSRNNATLGFSILVPVYNRFRASALESKASAELEAARLRWNDARAGIARQVRQYWGESQQQAANRDVARLELEVARRSLDDLLALFEDGKINRLAVEQARSAENQSWIHFFQAGYDAEKTQLELLRLSGEIRAAFQ